MKPSGIGGQAVIEGVMMKNKDQYAIAVRKPNNEIIVKKEEYTSKTEKWSLFKLPIFRGIMAFIESMQIGVKTLTYSAGFYEEDENEEPSKFEKMFNKIFKGKADSVLMAMTVVIAVLAFIGIFILFPMFLSNLLGEVIKSEIVMVLIEGAIRIIVFVGYVLVISQMKDIKRVFMYHGAEHKTINCLENGFELTVENVRWQSKHHKRCGTSFMLVVMFISIIFFMFIRVDTVWLRSLLRILLIPIIAGVSYEFIKLAGRSENKVVNILSKPGMWLQALTTREPEDDMIEVAIQSVDAVFDWKAYLKTFTTIDRKRGQRLKAAAENKNKSNKEKVSNQKKKTSLKNKEESENEKKSEDIEVIKEEKEKSKPQTSDKVLKDSLDKKRKNKDNATVDIKSEFNENNKSKAAETFKEEFPEENEEDEILRALDKYFFFNDEDKKE